VLINDKLDFVQETYFSVDAVKQAGIWLEWGNVTFVLKAHIKITKN
jgi:hypothetical protein